MGTQQPSVDNTPPAPAMREPQWDLYKEQLVSAREDQRASSDDFDKNVMTLSSGALALSVAFIKDVVHLPDAIWRQLLIASWVLFSAAVLATLLSFLCSGRALEKHITYLKKYYIDRDDNYLNKQSRWSWWVAACAVFGASAFVGGVLSTVIFASVNLKGGLPSERRAEDKGSNTAHHEISRCAEPLSDGGGENAADHGANSGRNGTAGENSTEHGGHSREYPDPDHRKQACK